MRLEVGGWRETDVVSRLGVLGRSRERCGRTPPLSKLEEVVGGANDRPFAAHVGEAAQQELAETARLFDCPIPGTQTLAFRRREG